jgi:Ca2+-binding RTX toxin-like protein
MFSYKEALQELKKIMQRSEALTLDKLEELVHQISVEDPLASSDATTVLYSGMIDDTIGSSKIIKELADRTDVRIIDRTPVAEFLGSNEYAVAVETAYRNTYPNVKPKDFEKSLGNYLYGGDTNGTTGPWAEASKRLAQETTGSVICIVPNASSTRTWAMVEMPNILNNPNVTSINGMPKELFQREWNQIMATADLDNLHTNSNFNNLLDTIKKDASEIFKSGSTVDEFTKHLDNSSTHSNVWLKRVEDSIGQPLSMQDYLDLRKKHNQILDKNGWTKADIDLDEMIIADKSFSQKMKNLLGDERGTASINWLDDAVDGAKGLSGKDYMRIRDQIDEALEKAGYWLTHGKAGKALAIAGVLADVIEMGFVTKNAIAAWQNGDTDQAIEYVKDWAFSSAGGWLLGTLGFSSGSLISSALLGGLFGGPLGLLLGIGGGVLGSMLGESIGDWLGDLWNSLFGEAVSAVYDPLILDLAGDGYNILSKKEGTYFDLDSNGFREKMNWTTQDGILALDLNGNGQIDDGREVFGNYTMLANGELAKNGFEALAQYDTNHDGIIDQNDAIFDQLLVWVDNDGDGVSDAGELKTLKELGIISISLNAKEENLGTATEAIVGNTASFEFIDGKVASIGELWVSSDYYDTKEHENVVGFEDMPNIRSIGNIRSLHTAMSQDNQVQQLVKQIISEEDRSLRQELVEQLLLKISGADRVASNSRGSHMNAQHLAVVEAFMGSVFNGQNGRNPNATAGPMLEKMYQDFVEMYYMEMMSQTILKPYLSMIVKDDSGYHLDLMNVFLEQQLFTAENENLLSEMATYLRYREPQLDSMFYQFKSHFATNEHYLNLIDQTSTNQGNDYLYGSNTDDHLLGGAGDDYLSGGAGNDIIDGGSGSDRLYGGAGDDIYIFGKGYGKDTISDYEGLNTIRFMNGISAEDIEVSYTGTFDVTLTIKGTNDQLVLSNFRYNASYRNFNLKFTDGSTMNLYDKESPFKKIIGTEANDTMEVFGSLGTHVLGGAGNDTLTGNSGDDVLEGGTGNDNLTGNAGNDVLDGGTGNDYLYGEAGDDHLLGGAGDDYLSGGAGNDIIDGGSGSDRLYGGAGDDIYIFGKGYGKDTISDYEGLNTIRFMNGISAEDIEVSYTGTFDVTLTIKGTNDQLVLSNFRYNASYRNFNLKFTDGSTMNLYDKESPFKKIIGTEANDTMEVFGSLGTHVLGGAGNDTLTGNSGDDVLEGGTGNDNLTGNAGNDVLDGGTGNDYLYGEAGDDHLLGGAGDDYLSGGAGNDIIDGGSGSDRLYGGAGDDIYIFGKGYGKDTISDYEGLNTIRFMNGISAEDIEVSYTGTFDVTLTIKGTNDQLVLSNFRYNASYRNFNLKFTDGSTMNLYDKESPFKKIIGTEANDTMEVFGSLGTHVLGGAGNDTLTGNSGDDVLEGGTGNDNLTGNAGNDVLDGGTGNDYLYGEAGDDHLLGGAGDDYLSGGAGNDIIDGGSGSDRLYGGAGDDIYIFGKGYGKDTISDYEGLNTIRFMNGISAEDIEVSYTGTFDVTLTIKGTNDQLVLSNFRYNASYRNFNLKFTDGSTMNLYDKESPFKKIIGTEANDTMEVFGSLGTHVLGGAGNDTLTGNSGDDVLEGGTGNDNLTGNAGNDVLDGGTGNDYLYGEAGDDHLLGGAGDDYLSGGAGNDIIDGGSGSDRLYGGAGDDIYIFGKGYGKDTISDYEGLNTIRFMNGISAEDIEVSYTGTFDVTLTIKGTNDQLVLSNFRYNASYRNFNLEFPSGEKLFVDELINPSSPSRSVFQSLSLVNEYSLKTENSTIFSDAVIANQTSQIIQAMATFAPSEGVSNSQRISIVDEEAAYKESMMQNWVS